MKKLLGLVLLTVSLAGCAEAMLAYQRVWWGADCRAESLKDGRCVAAR